MKKKSYPVVNIGIVPVFTIFVILCMVTFAVLSYMSADKDYKFSTQVADHTAAYYEAVSEANQQIEVYNQGLSNAWEQGNYENIDKIYKFSVPVSDTQELIVELERLDLGELNIDSDNTNLEESNADLDLSASINDRSFVRINRFEEVSTVEWNGDDTLNLMK